MKLFMTGNSPYARRPRIVVRELSLLGNGVEEVDVAPLSEPSAEVRKYGPGFKVPALMTDMGQFLIESIIICHYLDGNAGWKLIPAYDPGRGQVLALDGLGSLLMDSLYWRRHENARPANEQSPSEMAKETARSMRIYDALEAGPDLLFDDDINMGQITVVASLGYADWRHPGDEWRKGRPRLAAWFEKMMQRPSMAETKPIF